MVAHAGTRRAGRTVGTRHAHHQARARPIGQRVECGVVGILARVAVAGEVGIDEAVVDRGKVFPGKSELRQQRALIVGYEDIGGANQSKQRLAA